jgi:CheY-like chemotaxis protein
MTTDARKSVLVLEDDTDIALVMRDLLEDEGYRVFVAADGKRGLGLLDSITPDVIVTDMVMPVLDGLGFLKAYRERPGPKAPVIAVSAIAPYLPEARALGASAVLEKPLEIDQFLGLVRRLASGEPTEAARALDPADVEARRLKAIIDLKLDEPAPEAALHRFVDFVARLFEVPICLISIVDRSRQFWTAGCGIPPDLQKERGTPRDVSFCVHAVTAHAALVVQDARENPFFRNNELVRSRGIRFYAGVPLATRSGDVVGTLCIIDTKPHPFTAFDLELLGLCAKRVLAEFDRREHEARPDEPVASFRHLELVDPDLEVLGRELFANVLSAQACRFAERHEPVALVVLSVAQDRLLNVARSLEDRVGQSCVGRLGRTTLGWIAPGFDAQQALAAAHGIAGASAPMEAADVARFPGSVGSVLRHLEASLEPTGRREAA